MRPGAAPRFGARSRVSGRDLGQVAARGHTDSMPRQDVLTTLDGVVLFLGQLAVSNHVYAPMVDWKTKRRQHWPGSELLRSFLHGRFAAELSLAMDVVVSIGRDEPTPGGIACHGLGIRRQQHRAAGLGDLL